MTEHEDVDSVATAEVNGHLGSARRLRSRDDARARGRVAAALWGDAPRVEQGESDEGAEDEAADVGEERDAAAVRRRPKSPKFASTSW